MFGFKQFVYSRYFVLIFLFLIGLIGLTPSKPIAAFSDLNNVSISSIYESSNKYFYDNRPSVSGQISDQIRGVVVYFDNVAGGESYFVSITQNYPAANFTTINDCFSSTLNNNQCPNNIPYGTYQVSVEASRDIFTTPTVYTFAKLLVKIPVGTFIDTAAPAQPVLDNISSPVDADSIDITGVAEANSLVTVSDGQQIRTGLLANGATHFSINIPLKQNSQTNFSVTATDATGNISAPAFITVTEVSPPPVVRAASSETFSTSFKFNNPKVAVMSDTTLVADNETNFVQSNNSSLEIIKDGNTTGSIKGETAPDDEPKPSSILLIILYLSAVLFLISWGLCVSKFHFRKKTLRHRAAGDIDKKWEKDKH